MSSIASSSSITTSSSSYSFVERSLFKFIKYFTVGFSHKERDEEILFNVLNGDRKRVTQQHVKYSKASNYLLVSKSEKLPYQQLDMFSSFSPIHFDYKTST